jgi:uncharacterized membrane protein
VSYKRFTLFRLLGIIVIAGLGAWAGSTGNLGLLIPAAVVLFIILFAMRKRVNEVVVDERVNAVAYRASRVAFLAFIFIAVIMGAVLVLLAEDSSDGLFKIGITLNYSACALIIFYWLAFTYFNRKYGGKE